MPYVTENKKKQPANCCLLEDNSSSIHSVLFNTISDATIVTDRNFLVTNWNRSAEEIFEWSALEAIGQSVRSIAEPLYPGTTPEKVRELLFSKGYWKGEIIAHKKSGEAFSTLVSVGIVRDKEGDISQFVSVIKDISKQKKLEEQLRDLNDQLEQKVVAKTNELADVFNRISAGFIAFDKEGNCTHINTSAASFIGGDIKKLIGQRIWEVAPSLFETAFYSAYLEAANGQQQVRVIEYLELLDKWYEAILYPSDQGMSVFFEDVTDKKKGETALAESELRYRTIVETAQEGIWMTDEDLKTTYVNRKMCEMMEYSSEEIIGKTPFSFRNQNDLQDVLDRAQLRKQGKSEKHESQFITKSGRVLYTQVSTNPIFDHEGKFKGSLAMVTDITYLKAAEEEKEFQRRNRDALINSTTDLIWSVSNDYKLIAGNKAFLNSMKGSLGVEPTVGTPLLSSNDVPTHYLNLWKKLYDKALAGLSFKEEINASLETSSPTSWIIVSFNPIFNNDIVEGVACISRDVTEEKLAEQKLKDSEEKYRRAETMGKLGHWELDLSTSILLWSDEVYRIFELQRKQTTPDYNYFIKHVHPEDKEMLQQVHVLSFTGKKSFNLIHRVVLENGSTKYLHEVAEVHNDDKGQPSTLVGMVQDVTEQKLLEEELRLSENNYRVLFEKNPVPLFMVDANTQQFVEVNEAAVKQYEYSYDEFLSMNLWQLRLKDDNSVVQQLLKQHDTETIIVSTARHKKKNGEIIIVKVTSNKIFYKGKHVWLGSVSEITAEVNYARALKEREQQLSLVFNNTISPMWLLKLEDNETFRIEMVNESLSNVLVLSKEEMVGKLVNATLDMKLFSSFAAKTDEAVRSGVIQKYMTARKVKDDQKIFEVAIIPIKDEQQKVVKLLGVSHDLTEQKEAEQQLIQSEEKYKLLFDKSPVPMWIYDVEAMLFLEINPAAIKQYGYSKEEFFTLTLADISVYGNNGFNADINDEDCRNKFIGTAMHRKKNGKIIRVDISVSTIQFENKRAQLALLIDRTEQENIKDNLITTTKELRELASHLQNVREDERTNMAREIHDELGQQLTGLKMDIAWLNRKLIKQDENVIAKIKSSLQLIDGTINTVRKIASELRPSILDDLGLADAIDWHSHEFCKRTAIEVLFFSEVTEMKFAPKVSIALFRIFQEALTNVARHSGATLVQSSLKKKGDDLILTISDNGSGFDLQELNQRKTLGILGMKERVAILNGKYEISSQPDNGTHVSVRIPLSS
ncbi:PAS domain S-box protein [Segetibacter aerophilus]|uniref:histidine kinase n=1 Tax=Segetibacter aerophilus TaxID=670293 RepID=A0A512BGT5_9BACT|nr:PAS domain S-box protein [Segetibacter aerophilus]GEO11181.1 hypothetical protein SAE01_36770 [Segetibacter aerophilus]